MARFDREVADAVARYRKQVGRELTPEEVREIHRSPSMHGWIRYCRANHEHNKKRLIAEGWVQVTDSKGGTHWEKPAEEPDSEGRQKEIEWLRDLWNIGREPMADIAILPSWVMERWEIENDIKKRETDWLEEHVTKAEEPSGTQ